MAVHNDTGKQGEQLAAEYFLARGYAILYQNWRYRYWEIDIIASRNNLLHFIEVKCRSSVQFGFPEESISKKKIKNLIDASKEFLFRNPGWKRVQFDVLSINIAKDGNHGYLLIEDVYLM